MEYLNTDLKIFEFEDSETYWIVANNKEEAIKCYNSLDASDDGNYELKELSKDTDIKIIINEDTDLINIVNRYRDQNNKIDCINIWLYLKYWIIEQAFQENKFEVPNLIAGTVY